MESKSSKRVHLFRSKSEILRLLREIEQSNVSIQAFCAANNISISNIGRWRQKYGSPSGAVAPVQNFTRLEVTSVIAASVGLFAEVNGIKIYQPVSAFYLKELTMQVATPLDYKALYEQSQLRIIALEQQLHQLQKMIFGSRNERFLPADTKRSGMLYCLLGTCKMHGIEPYGWLKDVLHRIADHPINKIKELLPHHYKPLA